MKLDEIQKLRLKRCSANSRISSKMAAMNQAFGSSAGMKRSREDDGDAEGPFGKRARPTANPTDRESWQRDSVLNTPTSSSQQPKYDSDDQSSMVSEPGSPQDMMSSGDEEMDMDVDDVASYSQSPEDLHTALPLPKGQAASSSPWRERLHGRNRVATPFARPIPRPLQLRTGAKQHVRQRHPQEILSSDHLEVPSPIDEDEVPTPPSAAEAAGSQLSMLSVNDMDIETSDALPAITVDSTRSLQLDGEAGAGAEPMDSGPDHVMVRKQRQRSGAQSNGSVSPARGGTPMVGGELAAGGMGRRGLRIGFRADCEKCRMRVPGHMNHFLT